MPNYCVNEMKFADDDGLAALRVIMGDAVFDFNKLIPYPAEYAERDRDYQILCAAYKDGNAEAKAAAIGAFISKYPHQEEDASGNKYIRIRDGYNSGGCDWCEENWGTKWNAIDPIIRADGVLTFYTAWTPPLKGLAALARLLPGFTLTVEYFERGMSFCGGMTFCNCADANDSEWQAGKLYGEWYCANYHGFKGG